MDQLRSHLQTALELEHTTIPPYLCAIYTMLPGTNEAAYYVIRSVVAEEMLHMVLVANVLNAVGGIPSVNHARFVPEYPTHLPHSDGKVLVQLMTFSPGSVDTFMAIEQPARIDAPPESDHYHTIGQFYASISDGLQNLTDKLGPDRVFTGDDARQVRGGLYYGGGEPIVVNNLESALAAISVIVDEGEGLDQSIWDGDRETFHQPSEIAHYFRFKEIALGRYYVAGDTPRSGPTGEALGVSWESVLRMRPNPKLADYPPGEVHDQAHAFNECYARLLDHLHKAFNGSPDLLVESVGEMFELKYRALDLINNPFPGDEAFRAGPTLEIARARQRSGTKFEESS